MKRMELSYFLPQRKGDYVAFGRKGLSSPKEKGNMFFQGESF